MANKCKKVAIKCGKGRGQYTATLAAESHAPFYKAAENPNVKGKEGEELVAALIDIIGTKKLKWVERYKNGKECNGMYGEPSYIFWHDNGNKHMQAYFDSNCVFHNGPKGEPATQEWYENGILKNRYYRVHGVLQDPANGEPADKSWHEDGKVIEERYCQNGNYQDPSEGKPAVTKWYSGSPRIKWEESYYQDDERTKTYKWNKQGELNIIIVNIGTPKEERIDGVKECAQWMEDQAIKQAEKAVPKMKFIPN